MKNIYEGQVLDALPIAGGIVFAYVSEKQSDGKTVVAYRHINFETGRTATVSKSIFQLAKFGPNHSKVEAEAVHHLSTLVAPIDGGKMFMVERDGTVKIVNENGDVDFVSKFLYKNEAPFSVVAKNDSVWASFKNNNVIVKYDLSLLREELRIGGKGGENSFFSPTGLFLKDDELFVCNEGSKKIWTVNTKTYAINEVHSFNEPVYTYMQTAGLELVVLSSGVYLL